VSRIVGWPSVIPAGPRTASWSLPDAGAVHDPVGWEVGAGLADGALVATRRAQLASIKAKTTKTIRRMPAGSAPGSGVTRQRIKGKAT